MKIIYGGTFDPVHNAHVQIVEELSKQFENATIDIVPCFIPALKDKACASSTQRLEMLTLAFAHVKNAQVNPLELERKNVSYTVDTLKTYRQTMKAGEPLLFVGGVDTYLGLPKWYKSEQVSKLCHFVIFNRDQRQLKPQDVFNNWQLASSMTQLQQAESGLVYALTMMPMNHASSDIRKKLDQNKLPATVWQYIKQQQLYQTVE